MAHSQSAGALDAPIGPSAPLERGLLQNPLPPSSRSLALSQSTSKLDAGLPSKPPKRRLPQPSPSPSSRGRGIHFALGRCQSTPSLPKDASPTRRYFESALRPLDDISGSGAAYSGEAASVKLMASLQRFVRVPDNFAGLSGFSDLPSYALKRSGSGCIVACDSQSPPRCPSLSREKVMPSKVVDVLNIESSRIIRPRRSENISSRKTEMLPETFKELRRIEGLLEAKASVNYQDRSGRTPLAVAVSRSQRWGPQEIVCLLLRRGADPDPPLHRDCLEPATCCSLASCCKLHAYVPSTLARPLHIAAVHHDTATVKLLLRARANVNAPDGRGRTALLLLMDQLIDRRLRMPDKLPGFKDEKQEDDEASECSEFFATCRSPSKRELRSKDRPSEEAILRGVLHTDLPPAPVPGNRQGPKDQFLCETLASTKASTGSGIHVTNGTAHEQLISTVKLMLEFGACTEAEGLPTTPLHEAAACGNAWRVQVLIVLSADVRKLDSKEKTALDLALEEKRVHEAIVGNMNEVERLEETIGVLRAEEQRRQKMDAEREAWQKQVASRSLQKHQFCPQGHDLTPFPTPFSGFVCNGINCGRKMKAGVMMLGCTPCRHHLCQDCAGLEDLRLTLLSHHIFEEDHLQGHDGDDDIAAAGGAGVEAQPMDVLRSVLGGEEDEALSAIAPGQPDGLFATGQPDGAASSSALTILATAAASGDLAASQASSNALTVLAAAAASGELAASQASSNALTVLAAAAASGELAASQASSNALTVLAAAAASGELAKSQDACEISAITPVQPDSEILAPEDARDTLF
eukprot:gnl/TRDRNA2_/TRDRNA2_157005_c0_seq1.p1 gnl/TRDRNA2_/TRDRNA2_157005_c0~~gnl/TRDRNA2_/TRDRNA2_157005_c0_seq1.p1  ORF type:complete len:886 (-),score=143.66 gnl/TRDRNA2_/TRDRNA2_157005_c0_seq1:83-2506(-)